MITARTWWGRFTNQFANPVREPAVHRRFARLGSFTVHGSRRVSREESVHGSRFTDLGWGLVGSRFGVHGLGAGASWFTVHGSRFRRELRGLVTQSTLEADYLGSGVCPTRSLHGWLRRSGASRRSRSGATLRGCPPGLSLALRHRSSTPVRRAACRAGGFVWLLSRAFCGPPGERICVV